jgi:type I restriction enzyme S subunit
MMLNYDKYTVKEGDLIFNRTNSKELVGKTAVFDLKKEMAIAGYLIRLRTNNLGNPYYISSYLNSKHGKKTLLGMCKSIVGMANINAQELQEIRIMIPPVNLQNQFEIKVKQLKKIVLRTEEQVNISASLFQTLLQKAFKGELVA